MFSLSPTFFPSLPLPCPFVPPFFSLLHSPSLSLPPFPASSPSLPVTLPSAFPSCFPHLFCPAADEPEVTIEGFDGNWFLNRKDVKLICKSDANPPAHTYEWKL